MVIHTRYQKDMLKELHVGHPGIVRMKELACSYFWWPNAGLEIEQTVRTVVVVSKFENHQRQFH